MRLYEKILAVRTADHETDAHPAGHKSCIMEYMKGYMAYKQDKLNLDYLEIAAERRWGRLTGDTFEEILPTIHFNDAIHREIIIFLKAAKMTMQELNTILEKKPFAQTSSPPINRDLVNKLSLDIKEEHLIKFMNLAYKRNIP